MAGFFNKKHLHIRSNMLQYKCKEVITMENLKRLDSDDMEEREMSTKVDMVVVLNAIKKIVEVSSNPTQDVLDYINEVLKQIR